MAKRYDLVVIGSGSAASVAAKRCRAAGWSVAVIDHRPFGGTCALRGCDPKKILIGAAETVDQVRRLAGKGVRHGDLELDWPELMAFKRSFTDPVPEARESAFREQGIECYHGRARLAGRNAVAVDEEHLEGRYLLLASGAKPMPLGIGGEEHLVTSDEFMELDELPRRIVLVGGGYIAFEFAHLARRAGAAVSVLEQGAQFLGPFDQDLVGWLVDKSRKLGIDLHNGTSVAAIEPNGDCFLVRAAGSDKTFSFEADMVVHAAGRVPALDPGELDAAGLGHDEGKLKLNEFLQSCSNPQIYAAGDAAHLGPPLTPIASRDGEVVAANLLHGNHRKVDYKGTPSVVFTLPPLASVGLSEEAAGKKGLKYRVHCKQTAGWYMNRRVNEEAAGFKILVEEGSDRLIGAHLLGPGVEELINLFALALRRGLTATDLREAIFAYPTSASNLDSMFTA